MTATVMLWFVFLLTCLCVPQRVSILGHVRQLAQHKRERDESARALSRLQHDASTKIASWWRMVTTRRSYSVLLRRRVSAAVVIQASVRRMLCHAHFVRMRRATVRMQARVRATLLMRRVSQKYADTIRAVRVIQTWFRHVSQIRYVRRQAATRTIQGAWHCSQARTNFRDALLRHRAARMMQSTVRMFVARKQYLRVRVGVVALQAHVRRNIAVSKVCRLRQQIHAAVVIQSAFRSHQARVHVHYLRQQLCQQIHATVVIQSAFRALTAKRRVHVLRQQIHAAEVLQSAFRAMHARALVHHMRQQRCQQIETRAAVVIQSAFRSLQAKRHVHAMRQQIRAAVVIQSAFRGLCARTCVREMRQQTSAAVIIQSAFRAMHARRRAHCLRQQFRAAVVIQSAVRCFQARGRYLQLQRTAICMQRMHRANVMMQEQRAAFKQMQSSAVVIQTSVRLFQARVRYLRLRRAAVTCQQRVRECIQVRQARATSALQARAAIVLQSAVRGHAARTAHVARVNAHVAAQERVHRFARAYVTVRAVLLLQRAWRRTLATRQQRADAASCIQRHVRGMIARQVFVRTRAAACVIQAAVRHYFALKHFKRARAARTIQRFWRMRTKEDRGQVEARAAVVIQAAFRAYMCRRTMSRKLREIRQRVLAINETVEEHHKLGHRAASALDILLTHKKLTPVLRAVKSLDMITGLWRGCCEKIVSQNAVPILVELIQSCNRSKPHMAVLEHSLSILHHLTWHTSTQVSVFESADSTNMFCELIQSYRDKPVIFLSAGELLLLACKDTTLSVNATTMSRLRGTLRLMEVRPSRTVLC